MGVAIFYPHFRELYCPDMDKAVSAALLLDTVPSLVLLLCQDCLQISGRKIKKQNLSAFFCFMLNVLCPMILFFSYPFHLLKRRLSLQNFQYTILEHGDHSIIDRFVADLGRQGAVGN